jgi:hypothetical protein
MPKSDGFKNLIPYKKGQSGNPNGAPKGQRIITKELKQAQSLNRADFIECLNKYIKFTKEQIIEALNNKLTPALDLVVLSVLSTSIKHGDERKLAFVLDYLIGKNPDKLQIEGSINTALVNAMSEIQKKIENE